jgi:primosomal protein N' (replication factor Y) (superfamily II helicase)
VLVHVLLPRPFQRPFTYQVPAQLEGRVEAGSLVIVPLGKQELVGCVWAEPVIDQGEGSAQSGSANKAALRPLLGLLEGAPRLPLVLRQLLERLATYYHCPLGEALKLALPQLSTQRALSLCEQERDEERALNLERWLEMGSPRELWEPYVMLRELLRERPMRALDVPFSISKREWSVLEELELVKTRDLPKLSPPHLLISATRPVSVKKSRSIATALHELLTDQALSLEQLLERSGRELKVIKPAMRALLEAGVASLSISSSIGAKRHINHAEASAQDEEVHKERRKEGAAGFTLTDEQLAATQRIQEAGGFEAFLLHGVTGSGKTEVYLELIKGCLRRGQSALVLVPEIGLTPQTIRRFEERLGVSVSPWHSALSATERLDVWWGLQRPGPKVLVGARSALFCPLKELGVIIIDESHDGSYKQGEGVRYHARDMGVLRASLEGCPVVMGSATPSLECLQNARLGRYVHLQLHQRPLGAELPSVRLIDLKVTRTVSDDAPAFSQPLAQAIRACLQRGEQAILYLNRRGFSQSVRCLSCGFQFKCPSCELSLPWHQKSQRFECHHCEFKAPMPHACPSCEATRSYAPIGRGTERIEQQLKALFPSAKVLRLDRDSELSPLDLERVMRSGEVDLLVGTQMVTKGHDFPKVTLVGVLDADGALDLPDFRAAERCYQLISQVSGRAGRHEARGEVILQTYRPKDELLQAASHHDFGRFAAYELKLREAVHYPPFAFIAALRLEGAVTPHLELALSELSQHIQALSPELRASLTIQGPNPAPIETIRGKRRWITLLRSASRSPLHQALTELTRGLERRPWRTHVRLVIDVDPLDFM